MGAAPAEACYGAPTARFSVIDPHRMMQTYGLTDGFIRKGMITLSYGQFSVNASRCRSGGQEWLAIGDFVGYS